MFSKLLKHEFRNTWRLALIFNIVAVVLAFVVMLIARSYVTIDERDSIYMVDDWRRLFYVVSGGFISLYVIFMIVANVIIFMFMATRFFREAYSDTGYLMHALPVTKGQFLGAHLLCSTIWLLEFLLLDALCFFIALGGVPEFYREFGKILAEVRDGLVRVAHEYPQLAGYINLGVVLVILSALIAPAVQMLQTYCAISLGQTFRTHRVIGAFVMYFAITTVVSLLTQAISYIFISDTVNRYGNSTAMYEFRSGALEMIRTGDIMLAGMLVLQVVIAVILFVVTRYRMMYKLDLE